MIPIIAANLVLVLIGLAVVVGVAIAEERRHGTPGRPFVIRRRRRPVAVRRPPPPAVRDHRRCRSCPVCGGRDRE